MTDRPAIKPVTTPEHIERLQDAIEGELDGLAVDDETALAILKYVSNGGGDQECIGQMIDDDDIAVRLRVRAGVHEWDRGRDAMLDEAADEIDRLRSCLLDKPEAVEGEPVAYRHRLVGMEVWNLSSSNDMKAAREFELLFPDKIEIEPLFALKETRA